MFLTTASVMLCLTSSDSPVVPMIRLTPASAAMGALTAVALAMVKSRSTSVLESFSTWARSLESDTGTPRAPTPTTSPMSFPTFTRSNAEDTVMPSVARMRLTSICPILPQAPTRPTLVTLLSAMVI